MIAQLVVVACVGFIVGAIVGNAGNAPPKTHTTCARERAGGYELVSFKLNPGGDERECRYVKHGVR